MTLKQQLRARYLVMKRLFLKRPATRRFARPLLLLALKDRALLENEPGQTPGVTRLDGHPIQYPDAFGFLHSYNEIFQDNVYFFESDNKSPVIVDCGSNIGLSILYFKKLFPDCSLIGFEPDPGLFRLLQKNLQAFDFRNVEVRKEAVWIREESLAFETDTSLAGHLSSDSEVSAHANTVQVQAIRLKDVLDKLDTVDFLKIDIEFAELKVIEDLGDSLSRVQNLFVEFHNTGGQYVEALARILSVLQASGFCYYIKEAFDFLHLPFSKKSRTGIRETGNYLNIFAVRPE